MNEAVTSRYRAVVLDPRQGDQKAIACDHIHHELEEGQLLWLDIRDPVEEDGALLAKQFGLHALAIEDLTSDHIRPRCNEYPGVYSLILFVAPNADNLDQPPIDLVVYVGPNFLITAHEGHMLLVEQSITRWQGDNELIGHSVAGPLYSLLDALVDDYFPLVDTIADRIEDLEDRVFISKNGDQAQEIFAFKRDLLHIRRVVSGMRDAVNLLIRQDLKLLPPTSLIYYQSVYDHLVRLAESIDTYRDLLAGAMDLHLSVISNRMNQVMKTLTAISTVLMSAGLIAGIYGMNFNNIPETRLPYGYFLALGMMVGIGVGLIAYFKKIDWL